MWTVRLPMRTTPREKLSAPNLLAWATAHQPGNRGDALALTSAGGRQRKKLPVKSKSAQSEGMTDTRTLKNMLVFAS